MIAHKARRLPSQRGPAAWDAILPPRAARPALEQNATADFVVVGGGFAGLSAARRLRQLAPGRRIVLLEAGGIAQGAAGRNSGFMIDLPHELTSQDYAGSGDDRAMIALNRQAQAFAAGAVEDYAINPAYFDRAGKINGAVSQTAQQHDHSYAQHLDQLGEAYELLDAQAMQQVTGSPHYQAGLYTPGTVMLQPAGYVRGLAAGLERDGVALYENSPVLGFQPEGQSWQVQTPKAKLSAGAVILAVNGHLESFGQARGRLMHLVLFATMTPELDPAALSALGGQPRWGITPSDPMGTTVRRIEAAQGGNRLIVRSCAVLRSGLASRAGDLKRAARVMQDKFDRRFPQLAGLPVDYAWAGQLCLSLNGVAVAREIERGVYSACVQNGLGTARGTLTGMAAAEAACGLDSALVRHFAGEPAPQRLAPQPFRDWGANAYLRFKEWQAAEE